MEPSAKSFSLADATSPKRIQLRCATTGDLEDLRNWKNQHREFFFHKEEISRAQQEEWFRAYERRADDFMFMVLSGEKSIGCMGIRLIADRAWDVYNVILGVKEFRGTGLMSSALQQMIRFALSRRPAVIALKILKGNSAVDWYRSNGFVTTQDRADHLCMTYEPSGHR